MLREYTVVLKKLNSFLPECPAVLYLKPSLLLQLSNRFPDVVGFTNSALRKAEIQSFMEKVGLHDLRKRSASLQSC